jgi:hypothetical protein
MHPAWLTLTHYRPISWVLVMALLLGLLMPAHYHLHHLNDIDTAEHDHVLDLHLIADSNGHAHHDEDTSIIAPTPDVIVKTDKSLLASFVSLGLVLLLLSTLADTVRLWHKHHGVRLVRPYQYYFPPLRAPPAR